MDFDLDADISSIRAEIRALQSRKRFLSSSLLASNALQKHFPNFNTSSSSSSSSSSSLKSQSQLAEASPLVQSATTHSELNHHRIAFSTTAFPFTDPSPHGSSGGGKDKENGKEKNLLGVRIDVCARNGRFAKPYYVLLKRVPGPDGQKRLRVHRHTVPAFISMEKLERTYLPTPSQTTEQEQGEGGEEDELKPWKKKKQPTRKPELHAFVRTLRRELVSWQKRRDAVGLLREKLGVRNQDLDSEQDILSDVKDGGWLPINSMGLASLSPTTLEARYVRLEWEDGRVGRFKLSNTGMVERAVVIGDQGRDKMLEGAMTDGDGRVESVLDRLGQYTTSRP